MQATDIYARLAAALHGNGDRHALLTQMLEPIVQLSLARAGSVSVGVPADGRLLQIGAMELSSPGSGDERTVVVPLTYRGITLGEYRLAMPASSEIGEQTASFHRTIGALLGLVLHDASAEQDSRQAIVAEVHDGLAQTLVFARMRVPLLEEAIVRRNEAAALQYSADVREAVGLAQTNLRAILSQCREPMDPQGLKHALGSSVQSFRELTQVNLVFEDRAPNLHMSGSRESQVFLIVQEALSNIAKHARARHAWLRLDQCGDQVEVIVEDDGAGPPAAKALASPSHFGMEIMRQRAARLGGKLEVVARDGCGTRMRLTFPADLAKAAEA
jgi:two-component system nitrate/nitrite sensor histidine kinase NarX